MRFTSFRVFVYGSLLRGLHNHHVLDGARFMCRTTMEGGRYTMLDLGSYPALVPVKTPDQADIAGELYEVNAEGLARLDQLEGTASGFYRRDRVLLAGPGSLQVNVYTMVMSGSNARYADAPRVARGDWREYSAERAHDRSRRATTMGGRKMLDETGKPNKGASDQ